MNAKTFEVRDAATFIPVLAVRLDPNNEQDRYLLARSGYGTSPDAQRQYVQVSRLAGGVGQSTCDPYDWNNRTMQIAHSHIGENFDRLQSGAVVDVQFILGETKEAKQSESEAAPL